MLLIPTEDISTTILRYALTICTGSTGTQTNGQCECAELDIFTEETEESISETENVPVEHLDTEVETEISSDVPVEHFEETVTEGVTE